jgi:hypothetical protein
VLKALTLRVKTEKDKKNNVGSSNIKRQQKERRINGTSNNVRRNRERNLKREIKRRRWLSR